ncbi:MAG: FecR domain-containing protein, partial [Chitinophagaceae bacterium]|nr:FecR domain-containing protein [Chitinophagaceae bacterium]
MHQPEKTDRYKELASKWLNGTITADEQKEYADWYNHENEQPLYIPESFAKSEAEHEQRILANILPQQPKVVRINILWRAAAAIILVSGLSIIGWKIFKPDQPTANNIPPKEIFPANGGVTLVLGNGNSILLDTVQNGKLNLETEHNITKDENLLSYSNNKNKAVIFNTIATGKGKTYTLQLADGSKIWLDAASSVHFPTAFPGKERTIEVKGQVYIEVAKNPAKPFKVITANQVVEVLGTEFNVNAYSDVIATTLINGSVKIGKTILKPLEQAVNDHGSVSVNKTVDIAEVTAWKNGEFILNGTSLQETMNQLQ